LFVEQLEPTLPGSVGFEVSGREVSEDVSEVEVSGTGSGPPVDVSTAFVSPGVVVSAGAKASPG
jgi:hypothetical protein